MQRWLWILVGAILTLAGCTSKTTPTKPGESTGPKLTEPTKQPETKEPAKLRVLAPEGHFPPWLIEAVQATIKAPVVVETYANLEEARQKLNAEKAAYDVVAVSDRLTKEFVAASKFAKLDREKLKGLPGVNPEFLHHYFDRENSYVWPYACSFLGVMVKGETKPAKNWEEIWAGTAESKDWPVEKVRGAVELKKPSSEAAAKPTASGAPIYSLGPVDQLRRLASNEPTSKVFIPGDRSIVILYQVAISVQATQVEWAYELVRALFTLENAQRLAKENHWTTTQPAVQRALDPEMLKDPLLYPPAKFLDHTTFLKP